MTVTPVEKVFYLSPTQKVHSQDCRHCHPEKEGWTKLSSLAIAITENYQTCRLCCPPLSEIQTLQSSPKLETNSESSLQNVKSPLKSESRTALETDSKSASDSQTENKSLSRKHNQQEKPITESESQPKFDLEENNQKNKQSKHKGKYKTKEQVEKKRYKILAGNGCHQAIAEVKAMLVRPSGEGEKFKLILPDGLELDASFKNPRLKWLAYNNDTVIGMHWFRGYPKMSEGKLVCFQIIAWDGDMPTSPQGWEKWEFIGLWTAQKNLTVQRSMSMEDIRSMAKETGFIKKFKYSFSNSRDWAKNRKLWIGYVYKLLCRREGDTLRIQKVIPFACPRRKPVIKGKGDFKKDYKKKDQE